MAEYDVAGLAVGNGSGMPKTGFAGDGAPRSVFPSRHGFTTSIPILILDYFFFRKTKKFPVKI